jgi:hypothetical protein
MGNNLKIGISLLLRLMGGIAAGAGCGVFFGFFMSAVGFDFGIWKIFWTVFWGCTWLGIGIGFMTWIIWLRSSDL